MSYVVKYKDRIVLGIIPWNNQYIMDVMRTRYRVNIEIPLIEPDNCSFPLVVNEDVTIYPAEEDRQQLINPMIEFYYGPTWEFLENKVIAHYEVQPLDLNSVKQNYRERVASKRYDKEIAGTSVEINGIEYKLKTDRDSRFKYVEKLVLMEDDTTINWKFDEGWALLNKENLQSIVSSIETHVQNTFDEEYNLNVILDQAQTVQDILAIEELQEVVADVLPH
jgi:hypothetical protein